MLSLKANGNSKNLKDDFFDVTLNELAKAYEFVNGIDPKTKRYLLDGGESVDYDKLFEFKLHWISLFSDFTIDELRLIPLEGLENDSLSVDWLYEKCEMFMNQPESYLNLKEFKHKGKDYNLIEPLTTIGGAEMLFGKANYRQFMLSSQLAAMIEKKNIASLTQLFALLYSDGDDSSEDVVRRSKVFGEVNALYGWSAYFFFVELVEKYNEFFLLSTTENPPPKVRIALAKYQLKRLLSKTIFGRLSRSKWLKQEFSILEM